jgi:hypothetical protein
MARVGHAPVYDDLHRRRWAVLLRPVLVLPALALLLALVVLAAVAAVLGWFASLARGRMPRGLRDAGAFAVGYGGQVARYGLLATDRYPDAGPGHAAAPRAHPIAIRVRDDLGRPRLVVAFRPLLAVPHLYWLVLWSVPAMLAAVAAWVAALVIGRVPAPLHRFLAAFVRAVAHVSAFLHVVGRPYPGFVGREGGYPIDLTIGPPARQRRLGVLARIVLAGPALVLAAAYALVGLVVALLAWIAALVSGRAPSGLRDLGVSSIRYQAQTASYLLLLTSRYPNSSPVLDPSGAGEEADG